MNIGQWNIIYNQNVFLSESVCYFRPVHILCFPMCFTDCMDPENHVTYGLWTHNQNLMKIYIDITWNITTLLGHIFAHSPTTHIHVWPDIIIVLRIKEKTSNLNDKLINHLWHWPLQSSICGGILWEEMIHWQELSLAWIPPKLHNRQAY